MAEVIGVLYAKVNQKFSVTLTDFSKDLRANTKTHVGAFGAFGISQGPFTVSGTFKVSIPAEGLEFDFLDELSLPGGSLTVESPSGNYRRGYRSVVVAQESSSTNQETGITQMTYSWQAQAEVPL